MKAERFSRGDLLLEGSHRIHTGPDVFARLFAGGAHKLLDQVDRGLDKGSLLVRMPHGKSRMLGGRAKGFEAEVILHDWRALLRVATAGSIGWYQAWEAREWDSPDPVQIFALFMDNATSLGNTGRAKGPWRIAGRVLHWLNRNTRARAERNIHAHYDLGNDFYSTWLDRTMSYSSGYRFDASLGERALETSQRRKWERLGDRLGSPGSVLEIGCGWGSLANFFALRSARVTAISLSDQQLGWARHNQSDAIDFRHQDYRDVTGQFDAIVSCEMVEAVGREYWPDFFDCIARCLKPGGKAAIQWIAMRDDLFEDYARNTDFIQAYIFPGGLLIKTSDFKRLAAERGLEWQDQEDFALDYAETLKEWRMRFDRVVEDGRLPEGFDERFIRLWRYYLMSCEGGFRGGAITVSQVTLVKKQAV